MSEPIPVKEALRLIEMALEDEAKYPDLLHIDFGRNGGVSALHRWMSLARATMRPMLLMAKTLFGSINRKEVRQYHADYEVCAALRDHYDAVRPGWRDGK